MTNDDDSNAVDTRLIWAGLFLSLAIFSKAPVVDLWVSHRYYLPGQGFFQGHNPMVMALYRYTPPIGHGLLVLAAVVALGAPWLARLATHCRAPGIAQRFTGLWRRTAIASLLVALLSSGLAVEWGLKGFMGRPRPVQTVEFGGSEPFHGAFERGSHPESFKSFVSGHATAGFSLMSIGLVAGPTWRRRWLLIGVVTGGVVGMGRIMQGGHYLSDVVFAFYVVWLSCELVAFGFNRWDLRHLPPHHPARRGPRSALR